MSMPVKISMKKARIWQDELNTGGLSCSSTGHDWCFRHILLRSLFGYYGRPFSQFIFFSSFVFDLTFGGFAHGVDVV